jgi:hypothetical protein
MPWDSESLFAKLPTISSDVANLDSPSKREATSYNAHSNKQINKRALSLRPHASVPPKTTSTSSVEDAYYRYNQIVKEQDDAPNQGVVRCRWWTEVALLNFSGRRLLVTTAQVEAPNLSIDSQVVNTWKSVRRKNFGASGRSTNPTCRQRLIPPPVASKIIGIARWGGNPRAPFCCRPKTR